MSYYLRKRNKKNGKKVYEIVQDTYVNGERKRTYKRLPENITKKEAEEILKGFEIKSKYGNDILSIDEIRFDDFVDMYYIPNYVTLSNLAPSTVRTHTNSLQSKSKHSMRSYFGKMMLGAISVQDIEGYALNNLSRGVSLKTVKNMLSILKTILDEGVRIGYLSDDYINPVTRVRLPKQIKQEKPDTEAYTLEELKEMIKFAREDKDQIMLGVLALGCCSCGCRKSEMLGIQWSDFQKENERGGDYKKLTIHRTRTLTLNNEVIERNAGKTKSSLRTMVLSKLSSDLLREMRLIQNRERQKVYMNPSKEYLGGDYIFTMSAEYNCAPIKPGYIYNHYKKFLKKHELRQLKFHATRATYASLALEAGVPITVVSRELGHTTTGMTEKHYIALSEEYKEEQCEKLNMVLNQLSCIG